jgi:hypothetical protein
VTWDMAVEDGDCLMDQGLLHLALTEVLRNVVEFAGPGDLRVRSAPVPMATCGGWSCPTAGGGGPGEPAFVFRSVFFHQARGRASG